MNFRFDPSCWMVGIQFIKDVPFSSEYYLCDHLESCVMVRVGPIAWSFWYRTEPKKRNPRPRIADDGGSSGGPA